MNYSVTFSIYSSDLLKSSIELAFQYIIKQPQKQPELIHKIKESLIFDKEDDPNDFYKQNILLIF